MQSKNKPRQTAMQARYVALVASMPCSVCDRPGPSEVHEPKQGHWWLATALCADCHRGPFLGLSGLRRAWHLRKMDETDAIGVTVGRVFTHLLEASQRRESDSGSSSSSGGSD